MKKLNLTMILIVLAIVFAKAQTTNNALTEHDATVKAKDDAIKRDIIDPAEQEVNGEAPDWAVLTQTIAKKYDATTADRTITKAKIYFYYYKDWPVFCTNIVNYTDHYELANDYKLLNGNADMILKNSNDWSQLKEAQRWSKTALDNDPNNDKYKATYDELTAKIAGK